MNSRLTGAIEAAYASVETPEALGQFLQLAAPHFDAHAGLVFRFDSLDGTNARGVTHGFDDSDFDLYAAHYWSSDLWRSKSNAVPVGRPTLCSTLVDPEEFRRTEFAGDFLPRLRIRDCIGGWAIREGSTNVIFSIYTDKAGFELSGERLRDYRLLLSHLRRIVRLQDQVAGLQRENRLLRHCLAGIPAAVAVTDRSLRLQEGNERFQHLCRRYHLLAATGDRLCFQHRRPLGGAPGGRFGEHFALEDEHGRVALLVEIAPLESGESLLVLLREQHWQAPDFHYFQALWGLTERERSLLACFYRTLDLRRVSAELGLSYDYTRQIAKTLLLKSGTAKQAELVKALAGTRFD